MRLAGWRSRQMLNRSRRLAVSLLSGIRTTRCGHNDLLGMPKPWDRLPAYGHHRPPSPQVPNGCPVEDYTKTIYHLQQQFGGPVSTRALAERLAVQPASVSGMMRKLDDLGDIAYVRYHGVELSEVGRVAAKRVVRRHRLLELFLFEALGVPWDEVHDEAELLEDALSPGLCDRIATVSAIPSSTPTAIQFRAGTGWSSRCTTTNSVASQPAARFRSPGCRTGTQRPLRLLSSIGIGIGSAVCVVDHVDGGEVVGGVEGTRHLLPAPVAAVTLVDPLARRIHLPPGPRGPAGAVRLPFGRGARILHPPSDGDGVGPKVALAIVGSRPTPDLQLAIMAQDQAVLVSIPGIGKKLAERTSSSSARR